MIKIDIESTAGVKQGPGPITTAQSWRITRRIDRAGEFSFDAPLADARTLLAANDTVKRVARAFSLVGATVTDKGSGVVDRRRTSVRNGRVTVGGDDLLRELTYNSVKDLYLVDDAWKTPFAVRSLTGPATARVDTDMPNAYDGNAATTASITIILDPGDAANVYLYVGHETSVDQLDFNFGAALNGNATTMRLQAFTSDGWAEQTISNTTISAGKPFAQNGIISWTRPTDEVVVRHAGTAMFWYRIFADADMTAVDIDEVLVRTRTPQADDLDDILAYASGWSLDAGGYDRTTVGTYAQFGYESVLSALVKVAAAHGEHFRIHPTQRKVTWLRGVPEYEIDHSATASDFEMGEQVSGGTSSATGRVQYVDGAGDIIRVALTSAEKFAVGETITGAWSGKTATITTIVNNSDSGVRAIQPRGDPTRLAGNTAVCIIETLEELSESYDAFVTRVYPFGAGNGSARLTLANTTRTAPTGYTLDTANNYIRVNPEPTPVIEKPITFGEIHSPDNPGGDSVAADALFDAALAWLKRHARAYRSYGLTVTKLDTDVLVGQTIRVVYQEWTDGVLTLDIDEDLLVLETSEQIGLYGDRKVTLQVATLDRWPIRDADALANILEAGEVYRMYPQPAQFANLAGNIHSQG